MLHSSTSNLNARIGISGLRQGLTSRVRVSVPVIFMTGNAGPRRSHGRAGFSDVHRVSDKAILSAGADGAAQESIGRAFIGSAAPRSLDQAVHVLIAISRPRKRLCTRP